MMQKLKEEITAAANRELNRANEQFPLFTSKHEGVAVAYEELEESKEALEELETYFKCLWDDVRGKETPCYLKEEITPLKIAAVQKISEQNSPYKAMLDRAYMIGYTDAMNQERSHRRAARERRERKKYFAMQKLNGVALLIFTAVAIKILEGDATIAFITVPLGLSMLLSKEMLIINKYYWKCEEKAERGVQ